MLNIKRLHPDAFISLAYSDSAAYDLSAVCVSAGKHQMTFAIAPNTVRLIPTGLAMQPPPAHLILICSRSGLATRGIFVANAPGVVDPNYTGELKVALFNGSQEPHYVKHGDRIAQALIVPFWKGLVREVTTLPDTERGSKGFGSTGD